MSNYSTRPRILFVTPEVAFVPEKTGNRTYYMGAYSGCFGDFLAELINDLLNLGVDVHVAQPDYRKLFAMLSRNEQANPSIKLPIDRVHLAEDRAFFYSNPINSNYEWENIEISLNFQREVINQIAPRVQPDLIHCHDWMTGLIPAAAKEYEMPCLFTVQNSDSAKSLLSYVEDRGIDAAAFWRRLFYDRFPGDYEEIRDTNPLDLLLSGIWLPRNVKKLAQ
jgi:starch synthase